MLNPKIQDAFNGQLNSELYSAYLYLSMSAYFEDINLPGFASWMRVQTQEELTHAMKFYNFIVERSGRAIMTAIDAPPTSWDSPLDAFEVAYKHEDFPMYGRIRALMGDYEMTTFGIGFSF